MAGPDRKGSATQYKGFRLTLSASRRIRPENAERSLADEPSSVRRRFAISRAIWPANARPADCSVHGLATRETLAKSNGRLLQNSRQRADQWTCLRSRAEAASHCCYTGSPPRQRSQSPRGGGHGERGEWRHCSEKCFRFSFCSACSARQLS